MLSTKDYTGRRLDMESLQSIEATSYDRVHLRRGLSIRAPKAVAGMQKVMQRYAALMFTRRGTRRAYPGTGTGLLDAVYSGAAATPGMLMDAFAIASSSVVGFMREEDRDDSYGATEPDEAILSAELMDMSVDHPSSTVEFVVGIKVESGAETTYVVPMPMDPDGA